MGEVPLLKELYEQFKDQGVVVVGISLDQDVKKVHEVLTSKGMSWPQVSDADQTLCQLFNVKGTPTYYLIDRDGKIAAKNLSSIKKLRDALDLLLKKS